MDILTATFAVPTWISQGLANGSYERVGGVIREASTKKVVAWLRDGAAGVTGSSGVTSPLLQGMLQASTAASMLSLGLTAMGFAVVMHRLKGVEQSLKDTQELLNKLDRKIDLGFYANFQAALGLATNAFTMANAENRKSMAVQAINRFLEAQHIYLGLLDSEIELGSQIADEYLLTLALAYIAEMRCHLELEEFDTAIRRFREGTAVLHDRTQKYVELLLTSNPATYLHPEFQEDIDLQRLTRVYQWIDPSLTEVTVFERLREGLFRWRRDRGKWVESLPPAIVSRVEVKGGWLGPDNADVRREAFKRLPGVFNVIESTIETFRRFQAYQTELEAITQLSITFHEWSKLSPAETVALGDSDNIIYILPAEPIVVDLE